ncbi:MAG: ABC transporter ATP-binding protein, partial [Lutibacter sp.]
ESNITVFELVALGRQPYTNWIGKLNDKDLEIINLALTQTNTLNIKNKKYYELSDGQLQKVLIARALAQNTDIIILDEPTAHLDLHHTFETFLLLKKLTTHFHKTVIISTHEINLALQLASEIWLMSSKKFVTGKTNQLIETNQLKDLFDSDLLKFDKRKKQFIFQSKQ